MVEFFKAEDFEQAGQYLFPVSWCAKEANRILEERGVSVRSFSQPDLKWYVDGQPVGASSDYTHTALLINIQPIRKDTAADMLTLVQRYFDIAPTKAQSEGFLDHARKLLAKEGK